MTPRARLLRSGARLLRYRARLALRRAAHAPLHRTAHLTDRAVLAYLRWLASQPQRPMRIRTGSLERLQRRYPRAYRPGSAGGLYPPTLAHLPVVLDRDLRPEVLLLEPRPRDGA